MSVFLVGPGCIGHCDHPRCNKEVELIRGHSCGGGPGGGRYGCGRYYCVDHMPNVLVTHPMQNRNFPKPPKETRLCPQCFFPAYLRVYGEEHEDSPDWTQKDSWDTMPM